jgi:hypothetical protein
MPREDESTTRKMLKAMQERRRLIAKLLGDDERVVWDASTICSRAPSPHGSQNHDGNLIVTDRKLIYIPEGEEIAVLPLVDVVESGFTKANRNSVVVDLRMAAGDEWSFDLFPKGAKAIRRRLRPSSTIR